MTDWQATFERLQELEASSRLKELQDVLSEARKDIPRSGSPDKWDWFATALNQSKDLSFFVLDVFRDHPIPRRLFDPMMQAGIQFGDASTLKFYMRPCIETFGLEAVREWLDTHNLNGKRSLAEYWLVPPRKLRH